jgi:carbon-monoxide dehydrogenase medium subunit
MKFPRFEYVTPSTVEEAIQLLVDDEDARPIAGGQSLLPLMAYRLAQPTTLVDLASVPGLTDIGEVHPPSPGQHGSIRIGAMATQTAAETSTVVRERAPMLCDALLHVGHPVIRNAGTIGGSVAHADPAAEIPLALVALGAAVDVEGPKGQRSIDAGDFFVGSFTTALEPGELVKSVSIPGSGLQWAFVELARRHGDFALAMAAVGLSFEGGRCTGARITLGGVDNRPVRAHEAEQLLSGKAIDDTTAAEAARAATANLSPPNDIHGSAAYRSKVAAVLVQRAILQIANGQVSHG